MAPVKIRTLEPTDRAGWDRLWRGYLDFYESDLTEAQSALTFARLLNPGEPMFALAADSGNALVGLAHCVLHRSTWSPTQYCYLEDLYVDAAARGAGTARALIEGVYQSADALACTRVYWVTHETNAVARALYDRVARNLGFIQYRRA